MKKILFTLALVVSFSSFGQNVKEFETEIEMDFDFGITAKKKMERKRKSFDRFRIRKEKLG